MTVPAGRRPIDRAWWLALALAVVFLAAHLPFLASTLEDVDSINFALGVRDFDPGRHRPHPPGYPIYIGFAKAARLVLSEPHALAVWGALFGALAAFPLLRLFQALDALAPAPAGAGAPRGDWASPAWLATLVTVASPLYWMTAVRPMSDTMGLAVVLAAQALLATALVRQVRDVPDSRGGYDPAAAARSGRIILLGALVAALAIGVRSQAVWLTVPVLILVLVARTGRGAAGALIGATVWFGAGTLAWLVPLAVASGGPSAYLAALSSQANEDWTGVDLLVTNPTARRLAFGLYDSFIPHWAGLGWIVLALAVAGALALLWTNRRAVLFLAVAFGPYAVFHLLFQESVTTRYALPLVPPTVYLAVRGLALLGRLPAAAAAYACAVVALVQVVPVTAAYSAAGSPVSHAIAEASAAADRAGAAYLGRHFMFARPLETELTSRAVTVLHAPPKLAWREMAEHITEDGRTPVWFFRNPRATDLALLDPSSQVLRRAYRWPFPTRTYLGGVRPDGVDWIDISNPGWVAFEGWHLTPETAGLAVSTGAGLGAGPIRAAIRSRTGAARALIGGRHLGRAGDPDIVFRLAVDGRVVETWTATAAAPFFLRFVDLPGGSLAGPARWVPLTIEARRADTGAFSPSAAIEQFDVQDAGRLMVGYDAGWHEQELQPATGTTWRWTSERAVLRILPADRDVVLDVAGEVPVRQFPQPTTATIRAGLQVLHEQQIRGEFHWTLRVPGSALAASGGLVTIDANQTFRPSDRGENADRRALGLRVYSVRVTPAS